MRVFIYEHARYEGAGAIAEWATLRGHDVLTSDATTGVFGTPAPGDLLVVMGGPMGATDDLPWLTTEKGAIRDAISGGVMVFGVCLGAQLIASVLGAAVTRNAEPEVGWWEVLRTPEGSADPVFGCLPERFVAGHWHADTFAMPEGAVGTLASVACENQGFSAFGGRVVGLQCHLEWRTPDVRALVDACGDALEPAPWVVHADEFIAGEAMFGEDARRVLFALLDALVNTNG